MYVGSVSYTHGDPPGHSGGGVGWGGGGGGGGGEGRWYNTPCVPVRIRVLL